jgi:signal transduction histidine kinase
LVSVLGSLAISLSGPKKLFRGLAGRLLVMITVLFMQATASNDAYTAQTQTAAAIVFDQSLFIELKRPPEKAPDCQLAKKNQALPHHWERGLITADPSDATRIGLYCIEVEVKSSQPLAVYVPKVLSNIEAYWDGSRIAGFGSMTPPIQENWNQPLYFTLPADTKKLSNGRHTLAIVLVGHNSGRIGLSRVWIGPEQVIQKMYDQRVFLQLKLSLALMLMFAFIGAITFSFAYKSKATAEMILGLMLLAWSARSYYYFFTDQIEIRWVYYLLVMGTPAIIGAMTTSFLLRFHHSSKTFIEKIVWVHALVMCIFCVAYGLTNAKFVIYGLYGLTALGLIAYMYPVWLPVQRWLTTKNWESTLMAMSFIFIFLGSIWDISVLTGIAPFESQFLRHISIVPLVIALSVIYVRRYLGALEQSRVLAKTLAQRVKDKEQELGASYQKLVELEVAAAAMNERRIFVKNVHDGVGSQLVSALALVVRGQLSQDKVAALLRSCLDDLRLVIDSLDPETTDLKELLQTLCYRMEPRFAAINVQLKWAIGSQLAMTPMDAQTLLNILRITQEAFSNVFKHGAHQGDVDLILEFEGQSHGGLTLKIVNALVDAASTEEVQRVDELIGIKKIIGNGQRNMKERAKTMGGHLVSGPRSDGHWEVRLELPAYLD